MPVVTPSGIQFYISDLVPEVIRKCENRTSDTAAAALWLRDALLEISSNPDWRSEFVELEEIGPFFNLVPSQQEYNETNWIPTSDINSGMLDILIWTDPPGNTTRRKLHQTSYQEADKFQTVVGVPTQWYRFSSLIGFIDVPDKTYQTQARLYRQHPINDNVLSQTLILLPRDWNEILVMAAVERGFIDLLEYEKAVSIHQLLYGDPTNPAKPGLINGRKKKRSRESWRDTQALRPVVRGYGYGSKF